MGRTAFYTQAQYDNHTALIHKEDAARVRGIVRAQELPAEQAAEQARIERFRAADLAAAEARQAEKDAIDAAIVQREKRDAQRHLRQSQRRGSNSAPKHVTATERAAMKQRTARVLALSQPKVYPEAMYGSGTYGCVMHQRGHEVVFPEGRDGAVYCPGVDRHRVLPARPDLSAATMPPWVGSYSSHHGPQSEAQKRREATSEANYFLADSQRPASAREARREAVARLEADQQRRSRTTQDGEEGMATMHGASATPQGMACREDDDDDDVPSIFSHASSNGAVADTGCQHMGLRSTKPEVTVHLAKGGTATVSASRGPTKVVNFETLSLPELSTRIVRMQQRTN